MTESQNSKTHLINVSKTYPIKNKPTDKLFNKSNKSINKFSKIFPIKTHKEVTDPVEEQIKSIESHNINLIIQEVWM